jgi:hypothetical protein
VSQRVRRAGVHAVRRQPVLAGAARKYASLDSEYRGAASNDGKRSNSARSWPVSCGVLVALIGAFGAYVAGRKQGVDIATQSAVTVTRTVAATGAAQDSTSAGERDPNESGVPVGANAVPAQVQIDVGTGVDLDAATQNPCRPPARTATSTFNSTGRF